MKFLPYRQKLDYTGKNNANALIVGTGMSYSKFKDLLPDIIIKKDIDTIIGLNNLIYYDRSVQKHLTDYVISYSGYFENELSDDVSVLPLLDSHPNQLLRVGDTSRGFDTFPI